MLPSKFRNLHDDLSNELVVRFGLSGEVDLDVVEVQDHAQWFTHAAAGRISSLVLHSLFLYF